MALITIPTIPAQGVQFQLIRGDTPLEFFGGGEVIVQSTKAVWALNFPLKPQDISTARDWWAALVQLSKLTNTFEVYPPGWQQGAGYGGSNPLVQGGSQLGTSLIVDGASNNTTIGLAGDGFDVNGEFKVLTSNATTNGTGVVTLQFEPALRQSPANNAPVNIKTPTCIMRLASPVASISGRPPALFTTTVNAIETY
jgi:hypothetical protein